MIKKQRCRCIMFLGGKLALMHRIKKGREYYVYPGGGLEENESLEECVIREVKEEFGVDVRVMKKIYEYISNHSIQHYYLFEYIKGEFGTGEGDGEEFVSAEKGTYSPELININDLALINLMPPKLTSALITDLNINSMNINFEVKKIEE